MTWGNKAAGKDQVCFCLVCLEHHQFGSGNGKKHFSARDRDVCDTNSWWQQWHGLWVDSHVSLQSRGARTSLLVNQSRCCPQASPQILLGSSGSCPTTRVVLLLLEVLPTPFPPKPSTDPAAPAPSPGMLHYLSHWCTNRALTEPDTNHMPPFTVVLAKFQCN